MRYSFRDKEPVETYLGDGLYASFDGCNVVLRAPRDDGDHWVAFEPEVLLAFQDYLIELARHHPAFRIGKT